MAAPYEELLELRTICELIKSQILTALTGQVNLGFTANVATRVELSCQHRGLLLRLVRHGFCSHSWLQAIYPCDMRKSYRKVGGC